MITHERSNSPKTECLPRLIIKEATNIVKHSNLKQKFTYRTCRGRKLATAIRLQEKRGSKQKCDSGQAASATCDAVFDLRSYSENVDAVLLAAAGAGG